MSIRSYLFATASVLSASAVAQTAPPPPPPSGPVQSVTVSSTRDPVDKSYRRMIKGMDRFEREHALAPQATLRFRLLPRLPNAKMTGITLRIVGDSITVPVPIAEDNSFVLPRNDVAYRQDAALLANRKTNSMTWRVSVRTPGLPENVRRLGDLRLECKVGMDAGLISNSAPIFGWLSNMLTDTDKVCSSPEGNYLFFAEQPIYGVTLHYGERRLALPFRLLYAAGDQTAETLPYCDCQVLLDRSYYAPVWDARWPDDTLVEFDFIDGSTP
ncbi:MAG: hypothetical protein ACJ8HI_11755 [Massilia sp.]